MGNVINVCVETPAGSSAKYAFESASGTYRLKKILAPGLHFPYDFGFIPGTLGEDGDPLDIIIISEAACFPGTEIDCRIIGCLPAEQKEKDEMVRNDRFVGVPVCSKVYGNVFELSDLPAYIPHQLDQFFVSYNQAEGKSFSPLKPIKAAAAMKQIKKATAHMRQPRYLLELFLPLCDNKGQPYPERLFHKLRDKLCAQFDGVTISMRKPATGFWQDEHQRLFRDELLVFEVLQDQLNTDYWSELKIQLEQKMKQQQILIRCTPSFEI